MRSALVNRLQLVRDPIGMTLWHAGNLGTGPLPSSDPQVPAGCPHPFAVGLGQYDAGERVNQAGLQVLPLGVPMDILIQGWAHSGTASGTMGPHSFRLGTQYSNSGTNGQVGSTFRGGLETLSPAAFTTWRHFQSLRRLTIPLDKDGHLTMNWGGLGWWVAGVTLTVI